MEPWQQEKAIGVLQKAIAIEKEGQSFYQNLANRTQNPQGKSMFEFLVPTCISSRTCFRASCS